MAKKQKTGPNDAGKSTKVYDHRVNMKPVKKGK